MFKKSLSVIVTLLFISSFQLLFAQQVVDTVLIPQNDTNSINNAEVRKCARFDLESNAQRVDTAVKPIIASTVENNTSVIDSTQLGKYQFVDTFFLNKEFRYHKGQPKVIVPKKAAMYATLFPGLGQIYNRDYWKVPIVYALVGTAMYFYVDNSNGYNEFRKIYADRLNNVFTDKYYPTRSLEQIKYQRDSYKKYLDMTVLYTGIGYVLTIIEANVDAHLNGFDVSEDISMRFQPTINANPFGGAIVGLGIKMNFK